MANPVEAATSVVTTPITWAKAKPFVFGFTVLLIAVLAIKFGPSILRLLGKVPVAGGKVVAFATPRAASAG